MSEIAKHCSVRRSRSSNGLVLLTQMIASRFKTIATTVSESKKSESPRRTCTARFSHFGSSTSRRGICPKHNAATECDASSAPSGNAGYAIATHASTHGQRGGTRAESPNVRGFPGSNSHPHSGQRGSANPARQYRHFTQYEPSGMPIIVSSARTPRARALGVRIPQTARNE
jgi:hypothetical protein